MARPERPLSGSLQRAFARAPSRAQVAVLGLLSFCTCALLPSIHRAAFLPSYAFALLALPPAALVVGLVLVHTQRVVATYALLTGYPITLALSVSRIPHDIALTTFSPGVLGFAFLSLASYAAAAVAMCARPLAMRKVEQRPLGEVAAIEPEARRQVLGAAVLWTTLIGTTFVTMWASWTTPARYREQWARAAAEGATLTALVAGLAGVLMLALVGPALRADRRNSSAPIDRTRRLTWLLTVALSGAIVYALLHRP